MKQHRIVNKKTELVPLGIINYGKKIGILSRNISRVSRKLFYSWSNDGINFVHDAKEVVILTSKDKKELYPDCDFFQYAQAIDNYILTYTRTESKSAKTLVTATSKNMYEWRVQSEMPMIGNSASVVSHFSYHGKNVMYTSSLFFRVLFSQKTAVGSKKTLREHISWLPTDELMMTSRHGHFDTGTLTIIGTLTIKKGILVVYDASYKDIDGLWTVQAGAILCSKNDPQKILWRGQMPLWKGLVATGQKEIKPLGVAEHDHEIIIFWRSQNNSLLVASLTTPFEARRAIQPLKTQSLKRFIKNPIIEPHPHNEWETDAVFNPAAVYEDGKVHLLYRAQGRGGLSVLGYAASYNGYEINERYDEPAYIPREHFEGVNVKEPSKFTDLYASGGGWGGCEDPKLTTIEDRVYLTYVAFNGWGPPRLAMSSINRDDFLQKKWKWDMPQLISRPGIIDKSGCILPEKIGGKYVIFHRVFPHVLIDFVDSLDFTNGKWLKGEHKISPRPGMWDSRKLSIGAPPIKTKDGWLVIYHAVDDLDDSKYKIGAMLLDLKNPTKVLYRSNHPILSPEAHYENDGKPGVAYPCGAVIIENTLFVYYGGADRYVCVATAPLDEFLYDLKKDIDIPFTLKTSTLL